MVRHVPGKESSPAARAAGMAGRWKPLRALLACLFLASPPAQAAWRMEINANKEIQALLTEHLDLSRYQKRDDLHPDQMEFMIASAPEQVAALAATEGYFSTRTTVKVEQLAGTTVVRLTVDAGERTVVSAVKLDVEGAALTESPRQVEQLRRRWLLPVGKPFRQENWDEAKYRALQTLQRQRYAAARIVDSEAQVQADSSTANLTARFDSGPVFTLGEASISGTRRYPSSIISNINPIHPGEEYRADRLLEFQRQILRTPYFSNVVIDIDKDPAKARLTPVTVQVTEFPKQRVRGGVGYTTDTGAHLDGRYSHNDVLRQAWVLDLQTRLEEERQMGAVELAMTPDRHAFVNSTHFSLERSTLEGIELRSRRLGLRRSRQTDTKDISYSLEHYRDSLQTLDAYVAEADTVVDQGSHQALVAGISTTRRNVNNPAFPRKGRVYSLEVGAALKGVATDQTFIRTWGRLREYLPVGRRDLVILRAELGAVLSRGGESYVPASLMFRAGGTDSVRGYAYQGIGNEINGTIFPTRFVATGGVEYQHWLERLIFGQRVGSAVFYDVGTATDRWTERPLFHAVGIGARWRSPVGRVNADLAWGFQSQSIRPHISLGVAF